MIRSLIPSFIRLLVWASFLFVTDVTAQTLQTAVTELPNILFILTDDQRWDAMGCYGNRSIRTPSFDMIATQGARLDAFYVAGPVCGASRIAFISGLYPHQTGSIGGGGSLPKGVSTVATHLNKAGYVTGFIGKSHLSGGPANWGFQSSPVYMPHASSKYMNPTLVVDGTSKIVDGEITAIFTNAALEFMEKYKERRWFLWFATTAPHGPLEKYHDFLYGEIRPPPGWPKSQDFRAGDWARYYSTVSMLDHQVGRILKKLDDLGLANNTFIFVASDNGSMRGSHGYKEKRVWFEESVRVPALVRWPAKIKPMTVTRSPVSSVDFLPTVLELAGVGEKAPMTEGISFLPVLMGKDDVRTAVFSELKRDEREGGGFWQMVRHENFKYVKMENREEHLYDLAGDPHELTDLIHSEKHATLLRTLQEKLNEWLQKTPKVTGSS